MICGDDKAQGGGAWRLIRVHVERCIITRTCNFGKSVPFLTAPGQAIEEAFTAHFHGLGWSNLSERFSNSLRIRSDCNWLSSFSDSEVAVAKILCSAVLEPEKDCTVASTSCDESLLVRHHWTTVLIDFSAPGVSCVYASLSAASVSGGGSGCAVVCEVVHEISVVGRQRDGSTRAASVFATDMLQTWSLFEAATSTSRVHCCWGAGPKRVCAGIVTCR